MEQNNKLSYANDFVKYVKLELEDIKRTFFKIGFRLYEAKQYLYYRELGYVNIEECGEALFGFSKSTTYNLIEVYEKFRDSKNPGFIDKRFEKYSQSQLVALSGVKYGLSTFMKNVSSEDTVATINAAKKIYNKNWIHCGPMPEGGESLSDYIKRCEKKEAEKALKGLKTVVSALCKSEENKTAPVEQEIIISEENSRYLENEVVHSVVPVKASYDENVLFRIIKQLSYKLDNFNDISIVFSDDLHKVERNGLSEVLFSMFLQCVIELGQDFKSELRDLIEKFLITYDYSITLHGRKQGSKAFGGSLSQFILREINNIKSDFDGVN